MGDSIRSLLRRTSSCHQPWQLSAALALGVVCGLLPKFSLLFGALAMVCCVLPIHLPLVAIVCGIVSSAAAPLAPVAGRTGLWSLTSPSLIDMWSSLDSLPWMSWIGLNDSVVHGSLLIGVGIAVPVFLLTKPLAARLLPSGAIESAVAVDPDFAHEIKPAVAARNAIKASAAVTQVATPFGAPLVMLPQQRREPTQLADLEWNGGTQRGTDGRSTGVAVIDENTCLELEKLLATCNAEQAHDLGAVQVAQRAAQMAEYVDELLAACDEPSAPSTASAHHDTPADAAQAAEARQVAGSTPTAAAELPELQVHTAANSSNSSRFIHQPQAPQANQPFAQAASQARGSAGPRESTHAGPVALRKHSGVSEAASRRPAADSHQAETLRYLLEHLRAIKDKA